MSRVSSVTVKSKNFPKGSQVSKSISMISVQVTKLNPQATDHGPVSQKILSPLVILSMEKTMATKVISELKSVSRLKIIPETGRIYLRL